LYSLEHPKPEKARIPGRFGETTFGEMKLIMVETFGEKISAHLAKKFQPIWRKLYYILKISCLI